MKKSLNAWKKIAARFVKNKKPSETLEMALIKAKHVQSLRSLQSKRSKRPLKSLRSLQSKRSKRPVQSKRPLKTVRVARKANTSMQKKTRRMH
jgi:hypothetical protein